MKLRMKEIIMKFNVEVVDEVNLLGIFTNK